VGRASSTNTKSVSLQTADAVTVSMVRLLCVLWNKFWTMPGNNARQALKKKLEHWEDLIKVECPFMLEAVAFQRRSRMCATAEGRRFAIVHVESLQADCTNAERRLHGG
jgi:hypothetical protein